MFSTINALLGNIEEAESILCTLKSLDKSKFYNKRRSWRKSYISL